MSHPSNTDQLPAYTEGNHRIRPRKPRQPWGAISAAIAVMLGFAVLMGVLLNDNVPRVLNPVETPAATAPPTSTPTPTKDPRDAVCAAMRDKGVREVLVTYDFPVETVEEARAMVESAVAERCPEFQEETLRRLAG